MTDDQIDEQDPAVEPDDSTEDEPDRAVRDAQKYRKRAQDAEAERDALSTQLDGIRRRMIEAQLPPQIKPAAFWAAGAEVSALLGEDGAVDAGLVSAEVVRVGEAFGIETRGPIVPTAGDIPSKPPRDVSALFADSLMSKR